MSICLRTTRSASTHFHSIFPSSHACYSTQAARRKAKSTYKSSIFKPAIETGIPRNTNFHSKLASIPDWSFADPTRRVAAPQAPGMLHRERKMANFYRRLVHQARLAEERASEQRSLLPSVKRHRVRDVAFGRAGVERDMFSFQIKKRRLVKLHNA